MLSSTIYNTLLLLVVVAEVVQVVVHHLVDMVLIG